MTACASGSEHLAPDAVTAGKVVSIAVNQYALLIIWNSRLYIVHSVVYVWNADPSIDSPPPCTSAHSFCGIRVFQFAWWCWTRQTEDSSKVQGPIIIASGLERLRAAGG